MVQGAMAAGQIIQGIGGYVQGRKAKKQLYGEATASINDGAVEAERIRQSAREAIGAQSAAQFSNGMFGGTGSALDALNESMIQAAIDGLAVRREAESRARSLRAQGKQAAAQGKMALLGGLVNAGAGYVSSSSAARASAADWTSAQRGRTPLPGGGGTPNVPDVSSGRKGPVY